MPIKVLAGIGAPEPDTLRPGDKRPGEDVAQTRTPPATISAAMTADHKDGGRGYAAFRKWQGPDGTFHWGLDLVQTPSDPDGIVAPERCKVVSVWTNNTTQNFQGYGPAGVLLKGLTTDVYHLLGHLDPAAWSDSSRPTVDEVFEMGQQIGHTAPTGSDGVGSAASHVHWEVRVKPIDSPSTRQANTLDPVDWTQGRARTVAGVLTATVRSKGMPWWMWALLGYAISRHK
jgi:hypothetical protein